MWGPCHEYPRVMCVSVWGGMYVAAVQARRWLRVLWGPCRAVAAPETYCKLERSAEPVYRSKVNNLECQKNVYSAFGPLRLRVQIECLARSASVIGSNEQDMCFYQ